MSSEERIETTFGEDPRMIDQSPQRTLTNKSPHLQVFGVGRKLVRPYVTVIGGSSSFRRHLFHLIIVFVVGVRFVTHEASAHTLGIRFLVVWGVVVATTLSLVATEYPSVQYGSRPMHCIPCIASHRETPGRGRRGSVGGRWWWKEGKEGWGNWVKRARF